jgi:hypothetical protein
MILDNLAIALRLLKRLEQSKLAASDDPFDLSEALVVAIRAAYLVMDRFAKGDACVALIAHRTCELTQFCLYSQSGKLRNLDKGRTHPPLPRLWRTLGSPLLQII